MLAFVRTNESSWGIYAINADGSEQRQLLFHSQAVAYPEWSPDGSRIAFHKHQSDQVWSINVMDADGNNQKRLTQTETRDADPVWSPDGSQIAFSRDGAIWVMNADGSDPRQLMDDPVSACCLDWSPDGSQIAFESERDGNAEIYVVDADGSNQRRLTEDEGEDWWPAWSPDSAQIAFMSDRDGDWEIYVMDADGGDLRQLTDNAAEDRGPAWSPDGTQIAFVSNRDSGLPNNAEIYVMAADGTHQQRITERSGFEWGVDWRPEPAVQPAYTPLFEPATCRFPEPPGPEAECGYLTVPEDRQDPGGATVRLHVAIFGSYNPNPEPDPVIYLMGGGGGNALGAAEYYLTTVGNKIRASRDFIMYNQRGTHYNEPFLNCPGEVAFTRELDAQDISQEEADARTEAFLRDCRDGLLEQGVNLAMYNSVTNAADVNDLRIALGYEQVNYYGTSYGTRLGLTLMRYYPESIRSVILDSVFPPQVDYPSGAISSMTNAINRVLAACAEDAACQAAYPDLEETFYQVIDNLQTEPDSITVDGQPVVVDHHVFLDAIYMALHPASAIPDIPFAIDAAGRGLFEPLRWAIERIASYSENVATGVYYSSLCRDEVNFDSNEHALEVVADYPTQYADYWDLSSFFRTCEWWGPGEADPIENEPVVSDIPALIFAGYFDPITSPEWCRLAAETLSNSYYYEFPNMGHGVMRSDACALHIGLEFLDDPRAEPDAACLDELTGPDFR